MRGISSLTGACIYAEVHPESKALRATQPEFICKEKEDSKSEAVV
jgi:hypothetical protein